MVSDDTEHTCLVAQALIESAGETGQVHPRSGPASALLAALPAGGRRMGDIAGRAQTLPRASRHAKRRLLGGQWPCHAKRPSGCLLWRSAGATPRFGSGFDAADAHRPACRSRAPWRWLSRPICPVSRPRTCREPFCEPWKACWGKRTPVFSLWPVVPPPAQNGGETTETFAASIGAGERVSGYVYQTVPIILHAWLRHPRDFRAATLAVVRCGGDTDTTAAIVGGIVGAAVGKDGLPSEWLSALWEWPRTVHWMEQLGAQLAEVSATGMPQKPLTLPFLPLLARNLFFAAVVLAHGFRRLLPPY